MHDAGIRLTNAPHSLTIGIVDAPVVSFGMLTGYPTPTNTTWNGSYGASSVLWDNLWGTNYGMCLCLVLRELVLAMCCFVLQ